MGGAGMSAIPERQGAHAGGRPAHLAHHFESPRQQFESGKTGMWLFLSTEILLFSGLFCAYSVYRSNHPEIFIYAHQFLDKTLGGINTLVLIFSSLTAAWAVRAAQLGQRRLLIGMIVVTLLCACGFLGIKGVEYEHKWKHGLLWGKMYHPHGLEQEAGAPSSASYWGAKVGSPNSPGSAAAIPPAAASGLSGSEAGAQAGSAGAKGAGAGATGSAAGTRGSAAGTQGSSAGTQGSSAGARGSSAGARGSSAGTQGSAAGTQGSAAGAQESMDIRSNIAPAAQGPPGLAQGARLVLPGEEPAEGSGFPIPVPRNVQVFFSIYFIMTGLHGLHVVAGMCAFGWVLRRAVRGDFSPEYYTAVDLTALYWHLVDLIWIYLFPLLYLIR